MMQQSKTPSKLATITGCLMIGIGLAFNISVMGYLFDADKRIDTPFATWAIYLFQTASVLLGLVLVYKRNTISSSTVKTAWTNVLVLFATIASTFIAMELCFARLYPQPGTGDPPQRQLFQYSPLFGWEFVPNQTGRNVLVADNLDVEVSINSNGMRDKDYTQDRPLDKTRVVVLGDSFTAGLEVRAEEVFTEIMESSLGDECEVLNFAVNGFGPIQEHLMLKERAIHFAPDVVLMVVYLGNDFDDVTGIFDWVQGYQRPGATLEPDNTLRITNLPVPLPDTPPRPLIQFKLTDFHTTNFIRRRLQDKDNTGIMPPEVRLLRKDLSPEMETAYSLVATLIRANAELCRSRDILFGLVIAPTIVQVYDQQYWEEIKASYQLEDPDYDILKPNKFLAGIAEEIAVPALDLTGALKEESSGPELYFPANQHWTPRGHRIVAQNMTRFLTSFPLASRASRRAKPATATVQSKPDVTVRSKPEMSMSTSPNM